MKMSTKELQNLNSAEETAFQLIQDDKTEELIDLVRGGMVRINCLDKNGMNLLDQASFRGNETLAEFLIESGININNKAHEQGYTCLMFAALSGKPSLCQRLLDAGVRPHIVNSIGKTASELAAFVGQHECVSVISSYIAVEEIDKLLHPKGDKSDEIFPEQLTLFIHKLTRTHEIHPVRLIFDVMDEEVLLRHRKKILYVVDRLFERQLRSKEPNEILSMKLWLILFTLRELLKFVQLRLTNSATIDTKDSTEGQTNLEGASTAIAQFAKNVLHVPEPEEFNGVRPVEEKFLRTAILAFPYKQAMLYISLVKTLNNIEPDRLPSAFHVVCQALFGPRFVETGHFCLTCGRSSSQKRCKACKGYFCSVKCQKFDWPVHKRVCEKLAIQYEEFKEAERNSRVVLDVGEGSEEQKND